MKKLLIACGTLLFVVGTFMAWRSLNPPLSDEEQILLHVEDAAAAISRKNWSALRPVMADDFKYGSMNRKEVLSSMTAASLQFRVITLRVSGLKVGVTGDSATSSGHYTLQLRVERDTSPQISTGSFQLQWAKTDGHWKVTRAEATNLSLH